MADKPVTTDVAALSQYNAAHWNANLAILEAAIEAGLGRGGTSESPNSMTGDLDLDLNQIKNLPTPLADKDATNKAYVDGLMASVVLDDALVTTAKSSGNAVAWDAVNNNSITTTFETYTELRGIDAFIDGDGIILLGRISPGDGGGGIFRWSTADLSAEVTADSQSGVYVAPNSDATGASGAWVRQYMDTVYLKWFGITGADHTVAMQAFASFVAKNKIINSGTYVLSSDVNFLVGEDSIYFEGDVNITANGTYTNGVINIGSETRTLIGTTAAQLDAGDTLIPFTGLLRDELIAIWNPTDYSYSGFRAEYRQGEFAVVSEDSSGGNTEIDGQLIDTYPSGTKIYKLVTNQTAQKISGRVNFTSAAYATRVGLIIRQGKDIDISGLQVTQEESTHTLQLLRCFNVSGVDVKAKQTASTTSGLDYGLVITNCQHVDAEGYFHSERHGCTIGGDGTNASIINRWIKVRGVISTTGQGSVAGAEWHGNTEYSEYGGRLVGLIVAGHSNTITDGSTIEPVPGVATPTVLCAELKSFQHDLSNITIINYLIPTSKGIVDCGGVSDVMTSNTDVDGIFRLTHSKIIAPNATFAAIVVRNRGSSAKFDMDVSGLQLDCPSLSTAAVYMAKVSGDDMRRFYMSQYFDPDKNLVVLDNGTKVNGIEETGTTEVTTGTGSFYILEAVVFDKVFPFAPEVRCQYEGGHIGTLLPIATAESLTATGFNLVLQNIDNTINFSAAVAKDIYWEASINK